MHHPSIVHNFLSSDIGDKKQPLMMIGPRIGSCPLKSNIETDTLSNEWAIIVTIRSPTHIHTYELSPVSLKGKNKDATDLRSLTHWNGFICTLQRTHIRNREPIFESQVYEWRYPLLIRINLLMWITTISAFNGYIDCRSRHPIHGCSADSATLLAQAHTQCVNDSSQKRRSICMYAAR